MKKLVLFGAGKIGRSFIGPLFARSGYEVVFIDINPAVVAELNKKRRYKVVVKSDSDQEIWIENVRGVHVSDKAVVIQEITDASLLAVSVGQRGLPQVVPIIAEGILSRHQKLNVAPLDIIIAENMRNADQFIREELANYLPKDFPLEKQVGLVETSIGKMVPIMPLEEEKNDILQVFAEPYNTLILDKKGFKNPVPEVSGIDAKENMKAWVDCKAYIHNFGHAAIAYIGYLFNPKFVFVYEALSEPTIKKFVRDAMLQSADILKRKYPEEFTDEFVVYHIDDLIKRFQNQALGDTIFRVGCDLRRKLGSHDRIVSPLMDGLKFGLPIDKILLTLVSGYFFKASNERGELMKEDVEFFKTLEKTGFRAMLIQNSGIEDRLIQKTALEFHDALPEGLKNFIAIVDNQDPVIGLRGPF